MATLESPIALLLQTESGVDRRIISTLTRGSSLKRNSYSGFVINMRA